jgi:hypothetical protein
MANYPKKIDKHYYFSYSAADEWESIKSRKKREILESIGYYRAGSIDWDDLPTSVQHDLTKMHNDGKTYRMKGD